MKNKYLNYFLISSMLNLMLSIISMYYIPNEQDIIIILFSFLVFFGILLTLFLKEVRKAFLISLLATISWIAVYYLSSTVLLLSTFWKESIFQIAKGSIDLLNNFNFIAYLIIYLFASFWALWSYKNRFS